MKLFFKSFFLSFFFISCISNKKKNEIQETKILYNDTLFTIITKAFEDVYIYDRSLSAKYKFYFSDSVNQIHLAIPIVDKFKDSLEEYNSFETALIDSLFKVNIFQQYKTLTKNIDTSFFRGLTFFSSDTLIKYNSINAKERPRYCYYFSAPILSIDKNYLFIELDEICNGGLCGEGNSFIFQRENGKWILYKKIKRWIS